MEVTQYLIALFAVRNSDNLEKNDNRLKVVFFFQIARTQSEQHSSAASNMTESPECVVIFTPVMVPLIKITLSNYSKLLSNRPRPLLILRMNQCLEKSKKP